MDKLYIEGHSVALSIVIPAYNEASRIGRFLDSIEQFVATQSDKGKKTEVIVVCDGCTDGTAELILKRPAMSWLRVISYLENRGKGYAVKVGVLAASGKIVSFLDADGATPVQELERLIRPIENGETDIVIGSRRMPDARITVRQPWHRRIMGLAFSLHNRLVIGFPFLDTQCGCKVFREDSARLIFSELRCEGFAFDLEILCLAKINKLRVLEMGVEWHDDSQTKVSPLRDGFRMLLMAWRLRRDL
jgi:glycosyltransferase involved in cell wall biosynthesis